MLECSEPVFGRVLWFQQNDWGLSSPDLSAGREGESKLNPFSPSLVHSIPCSQLIEVGTGGSFPCYEEVGSISFIPLIPFLKSVIAAGGAQINELGTCSRVHEGGRVS